MHIFDILKVICNSFQNNSMILCKKILLCGVVCSCATQQEFLVVLCCVVWKNPTQLQAWQKYDKISKWIKISNSMDLNNFGVKLKLMSY